MVQPKVKSESTLPSFAEIQRALLMCFGDNPDRVPAVALGFHGTIFGHAMPQAMRMDFTTRQLENIETRLGWIFPD